MSKYKENDVVYLRCRVSKAPEGNQKLYRLSSIGTDAVVWAEEDEVLPAEKYPDELSDNTNPTSVN